MVEIGGQEELEQLEKNTLNASALSSFDMQVVSPCVKEPIEAPCLFRTLMVFQNCLVFEMFKVQKYSFLACHSWEVTLFRECTETSA